MLGNETRGPEVATSPNREHGLSDSSSQERRVAAWIGGSILIEGNIISSEDTTIAGSVEGDITVQQHTLVIAAEGRIRGNVAAGAVVVHGEVTGNITAEWKLELHETASVAGNITASRLTIAEGAVLEGRLRMTM